MSDDIPADLVERCYTEMAEALEEAIAVMLEFVTEDNGPIIRARAALSHYRGKG